MTRSPDRSNDEDRLLLREFAHRTSNEVQVAVSMLTRLAAGRADAVALSEAIDRLACFGELNGLLARPVPPRIDLGQELRRICACLHGSRQDCTAVAMDVDAETMHVDGMTARRIALVAAELVSNAFRHALRGTDGSLEVKLRRDGGDIELEVGDDGPGGLRVGGGSGLGSGIVGFLLEGMDGVLERRRSSRGTTVVVRVSGRHLLPPEMEGS